MKGKIKLLIYIILSGIFQQSFADYPIVSHSFLADPGALVYNGRVYIYCSNDNENPIEDGSYQMKSIYCVSSSDLKNWTDHGVVFKIPRDVTWAGNTWAPSPAYRNGKFYLYFANGASNIGVAVADSPTGPFKDPLGKSLVNGDTPGIYPATNMWLFDPMTFIDDDGQAYMYCGGNGDNNVRVVKLNEDMISVNGEAIKLSAQNFFEALWMHKHNGKYYLSYSTIPDAGMRIDYMISDSPTSGFTYGGVNSPQPPQNNNNNHHSNFEFNGQWYQAYHNRSVAYDNDIPPVYKRNICLDKFSHDADGKIVQLVNTKDGVEQIGHLNPYQHIEAETMRTQSGINTQPGDSTMNVCNIENGDWIKLYGVDFGNIGPGTFSASIASGTKVSSSEGGNIEIHVDDNNGSLIGSVPVSYTGGLDVWKTETITVDSITGVHDVFFVFTGDQTENLFNFDYWEFTEKTVSHDLYSVNVSVDSYKIDTTTNDNIANILVTAIYSDGISEDVTMLSSFSVNADSIVSITDSIVKGESYGEVTVSATYNGKTDEVKLVVKDLASELTVKKIDASTSELNLFTNSTVTIEFTAEFEDGHTEIVTDKVESDNPNTEIATLTNGLIKAISAGNVIITVSYKGEMGESKSMDVDITISNRDPYSKNEAEEFFEQSGIETEGCNDAGGGLNIGYIENNDWLKFTGLDFGEGATTFQARVASSTSGGNIEIRLGSSKGKLIGTCKVTGTGGWQNWQSVTCDVSGATDVKDIYLVFTGASGYLFNLNWWKFGNEPSLVNNINTNPLHVYRKNNLNFLKGTQAGDLINCYNITGKKIQTMYASSDMVQLKSLNGYILIEVIRGSQTFVTESVF